MKQTHSFQVDVNQLKLQTARLEQSVFHLCAGCADAVASVENIKCAIGADDFPRAYLHAEKLAAWLMQAHDIANELTIVRSYIEFKLMDNGEKEI